MKVLLVIIKNVAFVVVGTGVGGAMFTKGQLNKGAHLYGGEFRFDVLRGRSDIQ